MKWVLCTPLLLFLLSGANSYLLDVTPLDQDPVFRKVLSRRLLYPAVRHEYKVALMVYARFSIDQRGHVQNVEIMKHPTREVYHKFYDALVESTLKELPPLKSKYAGEYILPVSFSLRDYHDGQLLLPDKIGYREDQAHGTVLQKVEVLGYRYRRVQN